MLALALGDRIIVELFEKKPVRTAIALSDSIDRGPRCTAKNAVRAFGTHRPVKSLIHPNNGALTCFV